MPSFTGERARKYWIAVAARDAVEHYVTHHEWPNEDWTVARVHKCLNRIGITAERPALALTLWWQLDEYISAEERSDKYRWLGKLLPF